MIKLYDFLSCPYGQKVRIVLAEKALTYDLVPVDLTQHENRKPDFLRLNPFGRVPVLVDDDTTIYDSTIINEYLDDEYPEPPVLPPVGSSAMRSRARSFEDFADTSFTPPVGQLIAEMSKPEGDRDQSSRAAAPSVGRARARLPESRIAGQQLSGRRVLGRRHRLRAADADPERDRNRRARQQPQQHRRLDQADAGAPKHPQPGRTRSRPGGDRLIDRYPAHRRCGWRQDGAAR